MDSRTGPSSSVMFLMDNEIHYSCFPLNSDKGQNGFDVNINLFNAALGDTTLSIHEHLEKTS